MYNIIDVLLAQPTPIMHIDSPNEAMRIAQMTVEKLRELQNSLDSLKPKDGDAPSFEFIHALQGIMLLTMPILSQREYYESIFNYLCSMGDCPYEEWPIEKAPEKHHACCNQANLKHT